MSEQTLDEEIKTMHDDDPCPPESGCTICWPELVLEPYTKRKSPLTGRPYPRCQHSDGGAQCDKPVYAFDLRGLCYQHYQGRKA